MKGCNHRHWKSAAGFLGALLLAAASASGEAPNEELPAWQAPQSSVDTAFDGELRSIVPAGGAEDLERATRELQAWPWGSEANAVEKALRARPLGIAPSHVNGGRQRLSEFNFIAMKELFKDLGMKQGDPAVKKGIAQFKEHLLGSSAQKKRIARSCEAKFGKKGDRDAMLAEAPNAKNLGCVWWRLGEWKQDVLARRAALAREKGSRKPRDKKPLKMRFQSEREWASFARLSYPDAVKGIDPKNVNDAQRTFDAAMTTSADCQIAPARAGLVRNLEDHLPAPGVWEKMHQLYVTVAPCLSASDPDFEIVHQRMGFLYLERGLLNESGQALERALQAKAPIEEVRSLYWRGYLENLRTHDGSEPARRENRFWTRLVEQYPISLHALVVDAGLGRDPISRILARPSPFARHFVGDAWDGFNLASFAYLLVREDKKPNGRREVSRYMDEYVPPVDVESGIYLARVHLEAGLPRGAIKALFSALKNFGASEMNIEVLQLLYPLNYKPEVLKYADKGAEVVLVMALMRQESSFNPRALSPVGARGLMQVMPGTARLVARKNVDLFNPVENIKVGSKYLARLQRKHNGNLVETIGSYNAGPLAVAAWAQRYRRDLQLLYADLVPYGETRNYVATLLRNMHWYHELFNYTSGAERPHTWSAASLVPRVDQFPFEGGRIPAPLSFALTFDFDRD